MSNAAVFVVQGITRVWTWLTSGRQWKMLIKKKKSVHIYIYAIPLDLVRRNNNNRYYTAGQYWAQNSEQQADVLTLGFLCHRRLDNGRLVGHVNNANTRDRLAGLSHFVHAETSPTVFTFFNADERKTNPSVARRRRGSGEIIYRRLIGGKTQISTINLFGGTRCLRFVFFPCSSSFILLSSTRLSRHIFPRRQTNGSHPSM